MLGGFILHLVCSSAIATYAVIIHSIFKKVSFVTLTTCQNLHNICEMYLIFTVTLLLYLRHSWSMNSRDMRNIPCIVDCAQKPLYISTRQRWVQMYSYSNVLVLMSTFRVLSTRTRVISSNCHK